MHEFFLIIYALSEIFPLQCDFLTIFSTIFATAPPYWFCGRSQYGGVFKPLNG